MPEGGPAGGQAGHLRALGTAAGAGGQLAEAEGVRGAQGAGAGPHGGRVEWPTGAFLTLRCFAAHFRVCDGRLSAVGHP